MPHEAGAELRAQEGRPRAVSEARGKVVDGAREIFIPEGGIAIVDGTATTDAALARKLAAAVKRNPALKIRLGYAAGQRARAEAVEAIVRRSGATDVELTPP